MSRATVAFDRVATFVVAVLLLAVGVGLIAWWLDLVTWLPSSVDTSAAEDATATSWWPWAAGAVGLFALLAGLRWAVAHIPNRGVGELTLPGSGPTGRLRAASGPAAQASAQALADTPGVRSASGKVLRDRGQLVARLTATIEAGADLAVVAAAADQVAADLGAVLGRPDLHCRVQLRVGNRSRALPRVT